MCGAMLGGGGGGRLGAMLDSDISGQPYILILVEPVPTAGIGLHYHS